MESSEFPPNICLQFHLQFYTNGSPVFFYQFFSVNINVFFCTCIFLQVKKAMIDIVSTSLQLNVVVDIIVYQSSANQVAFTAQDYERKINGLSAGGMTNFVAVFEKIDEVLRQKSGKNVEYFMTCRN
jgi:hypothetical protein